MSEPGEQARFGIDAMLERARQLYARHFWKTQEAHSPIAKSVRKLYESLQDLKQREESNAMFDPRAEAFVRLTEGLGETLDEVDTKFGHTHDTKDQDTDPQTRLDWMQGCQKRIAYFATTIGLIVETLQRAETRPTVQLPHNSSFMNTGNDGTVATLSGMLQNFLLGFPESHNRRGRGSQYQLDPPLFSRYESADLVKKKLELKTKHAMEGPLSEEQACFWSMRHAIYWFSIGQEGLHAVTNSKKPQNQTRRIELNGTAMVAKSYLDAIKSAWLLKGTVMSSSFTMISTLEKRISLLLEDKVFRLLQSYNEFFEVPDYDLIDEEADFRIMMSSRRATSFDTINLKVRPAPTSPESSKPRQNLKIRTEFEQSTSHFLEERQFAPYMTESPVSQPAATGFLDCAPALNLHRSQPPRRKALERSTRAEGEPLRRRPPPTRSSHLPSVDVPSQLGETHTEPTRKDDSTNNSTQYPPIPRKLPIRASTDVVNREPLRTTTGISDQFSRPRMEPNRYELDALRTHPPVGADNFRGVSSPSRSALGVMDDGLQVSAMEQSITVRRIEDLVAVDGEIEVQNAESDEGGGFQSLFSAERAQSQGGEYVPARVRIFKTESTRTLHIWTSRQGQPLHESFINLASDEIVPLYAWTDNSNAGAEVYLRHQGEQCGLRYRFYIQNNQTELYGFQGALMESDFDGEYRVSSVSFHRKAFPIDAPNPKVQFWTEVDDSKNTAKILAALSGQQKLRASSQSGKDLSIKMEQFLSNVSCSRILVFANNAIVVLLITDRALLEIEKPPFHGFARKPVRRRARLVPNRDRGCTTVRARILRASRGEWAGIPLGQRDMRYADLDTPKFEDFRFVDFEFHDEKSEEILVEEWFWTIANRALGCTEFAAKHDMLLRDWQKRCEPFDRFRELQRNPTVVIH